METNQKQSFFRARNLIIMAVVLAVLALLALACLAVVAKKVKDKVGRMSDYQAVFLANDQVYFGKLEIGHKWIVLSDIYYLQRQNGNLQPASGETESADQPSVQLVKLGSELHGPEDKMYIASDKILFWENLRDDSRIVQLIRQSQ